MGRLSIVAAPTFKAKVSIPVAGAEPVEIEFTFKHRTKADLAKFIDSRPDTEDADSLLEMVSGWEFAEDLNRDTADTMLQNYIGAALAIFRKYVEELYQAKTKN